MHLQVLNFSRNLQQLTNLTCVLITEIKELQRSIKTYDMQYFPQHVLLCTSTVQDQSENIGIQEYLGCL